MSIPDRLSRIVRHKISEIKDKFDQMDEEALSDPAEIERLKRAQARMEAKQELEQAMTEPLPYAPASQAAGFANQKVDIPAAPLKPVAPRRTPQEIAESAGVTRNSAAGSGAQVQTGDPLDYHYKMLGLEPGAEFSEVQAAYNGLAARTDPSRFSPGSPEARELEDIRRRLELSYRSLRDALDSTAHRFGLLEFDSNPPR